MLGRKSPKFREFKYKDVFFIGSRDNDNHNLRTNQIEKLKPSSLKERTKIIFPVMGILCKNNFTHNLSNITKGFPSLNTK